MNKSKTKAVFFDCWSTLITFKEKRPNWNTYALAKHTKNAKEIDFSLVDRFADSFFDDYYKAHLNYEITVEQFLALLVRLFGLKLDCSIPSLSHEILIYLDPEPVPGVAEFLTYLEERKIFYAVISNTIYKDEDTLALLNRLLPQAHFGFFIGSGTLGVKKPNPIFFQAGVKPSGYRIEESMYIGDKLYQDAFGASNAGFNKAVHLNWKQKDIAPFRNEPWFHEGSFLEVTSYKEVEECLENEHE